MARVIVKKDKRRVVCLYSEKQSKTKFSIVIPIMYQDKKIESRTRSLDCCIFDPQLKKAIK